MQNKLKIQLAQTSEVLVVLIYIAGSSHLAPKI